MGCLPSINWCRILQPSTVTTYSNYKNSPFLSMDDSGKIYMTPWGFYRKRQGGPSKFTLQPSLRMIHDSPILTGDFPLLALNSTESFFFGICICDPFQSLVGPLQHLRSIIHNHPGGFFWNILKAVNPPLRLSLWPFWELSFIFPNI